MKLSTLRIPCKDIELSAEFYGDKLMLKQFFGSIEEGFVGYQIDNAQIIIEPEEKGEFESPRYLGFSVEVENLELFYQTMLNNGVEFTGPPEKQSWGGLMTHVIDPSANSFSIIDK